MASDNANEALPQPTLGQRARQAGLFVLFGTILFIPRIRRLRRRVWAWSFVRLGVGACATWLGWRYTDFNAGKPTLALSLLMFAFALLVRARPEEKSVDVVAGEMNALIVLNGGAYRPSPDSPVATAVQIFVRADRFVVVGRREERLLEIPYFRVQSLEARAVNGNAGAESHEWELAVQWDDGEHHLTTFAYSGPFAGHLAGVAEYTLRSQWKKELPVIPG